MSEKQTTGAGRRRSRAEVDRLVAEYEASGLRRQEFCAKHGLSPVTLDRYRRRRQQRPETASCSSRFLRVEVSGAKSAGGGAQGNELAVVLGSGRRIEVRRGFDTELLAQLVQVLERA
jgi:transposase-like protein